MKLRSTSKMACLCYYCHNSTAPSYVIDIVQKKPMTLTLAHTPYLFSIGLHTLRQLVISYFLLLQSGSLANYVRCASSLSSFKSCLRTYLFHSICKDSTIYFALFCVLPVAVTGSPNLLCCILRYFIDFAFCCCAI